MTEPYTALVLDAVSATSVNVAKREGVLGTPSTQPFALSWLVYGTTHNVASLMTQLSREITPTERQRGVQSYSFSVSTVSS